MARKRSPRHIPADIPVLLPPSVRDLLGEEADALLQTLSEPAPTSVRLNPRKPSEVDGTVVPWCATGRYLDERPVFPLDPRFHAGAYYVQEASSMLLERALKACGPFRADTIALDLCAAPGGKSTHLASLLTEDALLVCNEPVRARQGALTENLWKWGRPNVVVTGSLPEAFGPLGAFFDLILVDAPCSGEGMFRKDPFARAQWSEDLVDQCALLQSEILEVAWQLLRPGGYLIYSTCTWEVHENEDHIHRLIKRGAEIVPIPIDPTWGMVSDGSGLRCYPHRVKGEGLFIAAVRKPGEREPRIEHKQVRASENPVMDWLVHPEVQVLMEHDSQLHALSGPWQEAVLTLGNSLRMLAPGVPVAQRKGEVWVPHPALALSALLDPTAFPAIELDEAAALRYLRGEALPAQDASGQALIRYQDHALGWANGAGNRWNNGWPAPWRIRMR